MTGRTAGLRGSQLATGCRERCYWPIAHRIIGGKICHIWSAHGNPPQRLGRGLPSDSLICRAFSDSPTIICFERSEPGSARARRLYAPSLWAMGRRSWTAPFRLCTRDNEVDLSEVRESKMRFAGSPPATKNSGLHQASISAGTSFRSRCFEDS